MESWQTKLTSARFWMALMFSGTACYMGATKMIPGEGFVAIVLIVVRDYFNRARLEENGKAHTP